MRKLPAQRVKVSGEIPTPRFGHTFTMVSPSKAVLFGGAVLLAGKFVITNQTYLYDFPTARWTKLAFKHDFVPAERAAHAAVAVSEMQLIIYGGAASGNQGLLKDQLYILDLRKDPVWRIIEVANKGTTPGQRYGHTMVFNKPYIVVFGGNSGSKAENDVWLLNILKGPFAWQKYEFHNKIVPSARVYHSAAICEEGSAFGMMVVFGGRKETKKDHNGSQKELTVAALNDIWGLRKHRDGSWDWVTPPKSETYTPLCRYQHLVCFMGSMLVIMGGRSNNPEEAVSLVQVYDTEKSEWSRVTSASRYRHAIALYNKTQLFVHGGFQPELASQPLQSMLSIDLTPLLPNYKPQSNNWIDKEPSFKQKEPSFKQKEPLFKEKDPVGKQKDPFAKEKDPFAKDKQTFFKDREPLLKQRQPPGKEREPLIKERQPFREREGERKVLIQNDNIQNVCQTSPTNLGITTNQMGKVPPRREGLGIQNQKAVPRNSRIRSGMTVNNLNKTAKQRDLTPSRIINSIKNIRLSSQAVVAMGDNPNIMQIQRVPVNSLLEESKKLTTTQEINHFHDLNALELADSVLQTLLALAPQAKHSPLFPFKREKVLRLCQEASKLVLGEASLVGVRPPVKIFGSVYGRFFDLLRLFENFGFPDEHEMESNEYVFLGNYVDKGFNSLETVCLLMALKVRYPEHITLLRGKHEDATINRICGLGEECAVRLGENIAEQGSVFSQINNFFDCLPLAAAIEDKFLCVHSGIGSITNLVELKEVLRPVKVRNSQVVMDLLWSGTRDQKRLNYQSKHCSDEEIQDFLENNCLQMLINTRDGLPHGVDEEKHTLSVFSVTNYANSNNKAGMLKINKNLSLVPYLLNSSPTKKGAWLLELPSKPNLNFTTLEADIRNNMFQL